MARMTPKLALDLLRKGDRVLVTMDILGLRARLVDDGRVLTPRIWSEIRPALEPCGDGLFLGATSQTYRHPEAK